jgi:MFS family permease
MTAAASPEEYRYDRNIRRLYAVKMLSGLHFFGPVIVPFFTDWGGLTLSEVFNLNAWFMLCICLLEVPTGTVADYLGRKASLAIGCFLGGIACAIYASAPHLAVFVLGEFVFAASFALQSGADDALAYESLKRAGRETSAPRILPRMEAFKLAGINAAALTGGFIAAWGGSARRCSRTWCRPSPRARWRSRSANRRAAPPARTDARTGPSWRTAAASS